MSLPPVNPPLIRSVDLTAFPRLFEGRIPDVQPFSMRSGSSYQEQLERLTRWARAVQQYLDAIDSGNDEVIQALGNALVAQGQYVSSQLQTVLAQIVAGENVTLNDASILAALESAGSVAVTYGLGHRTLAGSGIDPTGAAVSTAAVQAFFDAQPAGQAVVIPAGVVIALDGTITLHKRVHVRGGGELRWVAGIAHSPMLLVLGNGSTFDGLYLTNPNHLAAPDGDRTSGICITANAVRVHGCHIVGQQGAILVDANGEWHDTIVTDNIVSDVPGSGGGPSNKANPYGEDRGDGIYVMGATAVITGNRVSALDGTDARIGIGLENLASYETVPYAHGDAMCIVANNVVTGTFRRSIVSEGVTDCVISANTVADATFWGIAVINTAHRNIVIGNAVRMTRNAATDAAQWITRSGIYVYDNVGAGLIADNEIYVNPDATIEYGVGCHVGGGGLSSDLIIRNNIIDGNGRMGVGVQFENGGLRPRVLGNTIRGFTATGINLIATDPEISGNRLDGPGTTGKGISTNAGNSSGRITGNIVRQVSGAIEAYFHASWLVVSDNVIDTATEGVNLYGTAANTPVQVSNNLMAAVGTHYNNLPTNPTSQGNN